MFKVNKTFETWTEDDLEAGETDTRGFEFEDEEMSLKDIVKAAKDGGYSFSSSPDGNLEHGFLVTEDGDIDYQTGESTSYALHISGSRRNLVRLTRALKANGVR